MSQGIVVQLERDGPSSSWGFRLYGGQDVGCPLSVQRVFLGTASEGELQRGDVIVRIGNRDTNKLTHQEAHDIIKKAGNHLSLVINRLQGSRSPVATPYLSGNVHPLATPTPSAVTPSATSTMNRPMPGFYATLPTTQFTDHYRPYAPEPQALAAVEDYEYCEEKSREKSAIVHQAYRTLPLIAPKAKTKHDYPSGSYLRHVQDPNVTQPPHQGATTLQNIAAIRKIQEAAAMTNVPVLTAHVESSNQPGAVESVPFLRQYNSPINMYSAQNVADTLSAQTGLQPNRAANSNVAPAPVIAAHSPRSHYQPPPTVNINKLAEPQRPTPLPFQVSDITQSPTYRLIHDDEWSELNMRKVALKEHKPVGNQVYDHPEAPDAWINALGLPKGKISQSGSFNTIMSTLTMYPAQQQF